MRRSLRRWIRAAALATPLVQASGALAIDREAILAPTTDFSAAERWEELPGGSTTQRRRFDREAFSQPSANLAFERRGDFFVGNGFFRRAWVSSPASTRAADGLGPLYNARSCQSCHLKDGRGHPPASEDDGAVSILVRLARLVDGELAPDPVYGGQIQDLATPGARAEARLRITWTESEVELAGGEIVSLRAPELALDDLGYGPLADGVRTSLRVAQPMIGLGLLERVAEEDLSALADPGDEDGDGISGRLARVWSVDRQSTLAGRFGWKASQPTVRDQTAAAASGDVGLSSPLAPDPWGDCTDRQVEGCRSLPSGADERYDGFEIDDAILDALTFYSQNLAPPARRDAGDPEVLAGKERFYEIGCAACHRPKLATATSDDPRDAHLGGQLIWPYSDLLLHDMGPGLADPSGEGDASGAEWRTPPLWGLGFTETVNGHSFFLHDGRARSLQEAILWHGGEAEAAKERYRALPPDDRALLLRFLRSL